MKSILLTSRVAKYWIAQKFNFRWLPNYRHMLIKDPGWEEYSTLSPATRACMCLYRKPAISMFIWFIRSPRKSRLSRSINLNSWIILPLLEIWWRQESLGAQLTSLYQKMYHWAWCLLARLAPKSQNLTSLTRMSLYWRNMQRLIHNNYSRPNRSFLVVDLMTLQN